MIKEFLIALIVSLDTYLASAAYCNSGIRIPVSSSLIISGLSAAVMGITIKFAWVLGNFIPAKLCRVICTAVLIFIGMFILVKSLTRNIVYRLSKKGWLSMKVKGCSVVMKLYLDDTAADLDNSKILTAGEAAVLSAATSMDAAAIGLSCGLGDTDPIYGAVFTFLCGFGAVLLGSLTGKKISSLHRDLSWLGGIFLIIFAFLD